MLQSRLAMQSSDRISRGRATPSHDRVRLTYTPSLESSGDWCGESWRPRSCSGDKLHPVTLSPYVEPRAAHTRCGLSRMGVRAHALLTLVAPPLCEPHPYFALPPTSHSHHRLSTQPSGGSPHRPFSFISSKRTMARSASTRSQASMARSYVCAVGARPAAVRSS